MPEQDRLKWNEKYTNGALADDPPSKVLLSLDKSLPPKGRALDLGGGAGRNAIWLANRGLDVTIADVSDVGLKLASDRAHTSGVAIQTALVDLEEQSLPEGPWDLILSVLFLWRPLFRELPRMLSTGGTFVMIHPTVSNLQKHNSPSKRFLLDDGELPALCSELEIISYREGWLDDGRHDAALVAKKI